MCSLTMDIIQWLLLDEKLVRNWRSFAWRLGLSEYIVSIECWRGEKERRRRGWRDKDKLEMLLRMWKEKKPETYHTDMLKTALAKEVMIIFFFLSSKNDMPVYFVKYQYSGQQSANRHKDNVCNIWH